MKHLSFLAAALLALPAFAQDINALTGSARAQVGVTVIYDPAYVRLDFPAGDVPEDRGVCTDVLIRAFRAGWGLDLQRVTNADMKRAFAKYPKTWGLKSTDRNIDHRRVPNLQALFSRAGAARAISQSAADYQAGDIISWMLPGNLPHIGIVSDRSSADGARPLILHNIGRGAREEDMLFDYQITGHYRIDAKALDWLRALDR